jgi:K+-sensing histidine kinase KdpD
MFFFLISFLAEPSLSFLYFFISQTQIVAILTLIKTYSNQQTFQNQVTVIFLRNVLFHKLFTKYNKALVHLLVI